MSEAEAQAKAILREEVKELATQLYYSYEEHKSPTPMYGRSTEWDQMWVATIMEFVQARERAVWANVEKEFDSHRNEKIFLDCRQMVAEFCIKCRQHAQEVGP